MKKAEMNVIRFDADDVIATSGVPINKIRFTGIDSVEGNLTLYVDDNPTGITGYDSIYNTLIANNASATISGAVRIGFPLNDIIAYKNYKSSSDFHTTDIAGSVSKITNDTTYTWDSSKTSFIKQ